MLDSTTPLAAYSEYLRGIFSTVQKLFSAGSKKLHASASLWFTDILCEIFSSMQKPADQRVCRGQFQIR